MLQHPVNWKRQSIPKTTQRFPPFHPSTCAYRLSPFHTPFIRLPTPSNPSLPPPTFTYSPPPHPTNHPLSSLPPLTPLSSPSSDQPFPFHFPLSPHPTTPIQPEKSKFKMAKLALSVQQGKLLGPPNSLMLEHVNHISLGREPRAFSTIV